MLTFKQPEEGTEPGEIQSIENLTDDQEFSVDDLDVADMEQIKYLFKDALLSFMSIKNGLGVDEFPEFEPEGIDDPLLAPDVEDYDPNQLAVGTQVEKEHTDYEQAAQKIAKHHLAEDPQYYTKLLKTGLVDEESALKLAQALDIIDQDEVQEALRGVNESTGPRAEIFITDTGFSPTVNQSDGASFNLPRYGVWSVKPNQKPNVIETSDNLDQLLGKYKLTENDVIKFVPEQ